MPPRLSTGLEDPSSTGLPQMHPGQESQASNGGVKRPREDDDELDEDDDDEGGKKERRKIEIAFIKDKSRRHITFSKRKAGIMKKAYELSVLTGTQVLLLVVSETGLVYTFTTPKLQPLVTKPEGKNLIQSCLNAPDTSNSNEDEDSPAPAPTPKRQNTGNANATRGIALPPPPAYPSSSSSSNYPDQSTYPAYLPSSSSGYRS